jgi:hypothetical protein
VKPKTHIHAKRQSATKTYKIKPATPSDTDQREIIGKDPPAVHASLFFRNASLYRLIKVYRTIRFYRFLAHPIGLCKLFDNKNQNGS